jgi:hypothetical protein
MRVVASMAAVVAAAMACVGCAGAEMDTEVQSSQSAFMSAATGGLIVPAYFSADAQGDASFAEITSGHRSILPEIAIVNAGCDSTGRKNQQTGGCLIGGGPGPSRSTYVHDKIAYLRAQGIKVFGYVWVGSVTTGGQTAYRATEDIVADMRAWAENYADDGNPLTVLNGFFFDSAYRRSANGVPQAEYIAKQAAQYATWAGPAVGEIADTAGGRSIFNWGTTADTYMRGYLDCVLRLGSSGSDGWNYVVVQEDAAADFMGTNGQLPAWARYQYNPGHFISIVHHASSDASDTQALLDTARQSWNSAYTYITDLPAEGEGHYYSAAPAAAVWGAQAAQGGTASFVYGVTDDVLATSCPAPSAATPSYP